MTDRELPDYGPGLTGGVQSMGAGRQLPGFPSGADLSRRPAPVERLRRGEYQLGDSPSGGGSSAGGACTCQGGCGRTMDDVRNRQSVPKSAFLLPRPDVTQAVPPCMRGGGCGASSRGERPARDVYAQHGSFAPPFHAFPDAGIGGVVGSGAASGSSVTQDSLLTIIQNAIRDGWFVFGGCQPGTCRDPISGSCLTPLEWKNLYGIACGQPPGCTDPTWVAGWNALMDECGPNCPCPLPSDTCTNGECIHAPAGNGGLSDAEIAKKKAGLDSGQTEPDCGCAKNLRCGYQKTDKNGTTALLYDGTKPCDPNYTYKPACLPYPGGVPLCMVWNGSGFDVNIIEPCGEYKTAVGAVPKKWMKICK